MSSGDRFPYNQQGKKHHVLKQTDVSGIGLNQKRWRTKESGSTSDSFVKVGM